MHINHIHLVALLAYVTCVAHGVNLLATIITSIYVVSIYAQYMCIYLLAFACLFLSFLRVCQEYI